MSLAVRLLRGIFYGMAFLVGFAVYAHSDSTTITSTEELPKVIAPREQDLSLEKALDLTLTYNYNVRARAEEVFRARQNINIAIGRLLPSLNMGVAFALAYQAYVDVAILSAGFLFPSNWFRWRESKLFFEAERSSFASLLANQVNAVEAIYYRLGALHRDLAIYTRYVGVVEEIIHDAPIVIGERELYEQPLRELFNLRLVLTLDHQNICRTLASVYPDFYHALGLDPQIWERYHVANIASPDLQQWPRRDDDQSLYPVVLKRSQELRSLAFVIAASRFSTYARYFDFLLPSFSSESSLGFSYPANIKIGRSLTRQYEVRLTETKSELRRSLDQTLADYKWSLKSYATHHEQLRNAKELLIVLKRRFYELKYFNDDMADAISFMISAEIGANENTRIAMTADAQLRRLLWEGDHYQRALSIAFAKKPAERLNLQQKIEQMKIKRAMKKGQLPANLEEADFEDLIPAMPSAEYPVPPVDPAA